MLLREQIWSLKAKSYGHWNENVKISFSGISSSKMGRFTITSNQGRDGQRTITHIVEYISLAEMSHTSHTFRLLNMGNAVEVYIFRERYPYASEWWCKSKIKRISRSLGKKM